MKDIFKDVLEVKGVQGVLFLTDAGDIAHQDLEGILNTSVGKDQIDLLTSRDNWTDIQKIFTSVDEAEFIYNELRIYTRKTAGGVLMIFLDAITSLSLVQLNIDIVMPTLDKVKKAKGLGRFFKR